MRFIFAFALWSSFNVVKCNNIGWWWSFQPGSLVKATDNASGQEFGVFKPQIWITASISILGESLFGAIHENNVFLWPFIHWFDKSKRWIRCHHLCILAIVHPSTFGQFSESSLPQGGVFNFLHRLAAVTSPQQNPTKKDSDAHFKSYSTQQRPYRSGQGQNSDTGK